MTERLLWVCLQALLFSLVFGFEGTIELSPHYQLKACKHGLFILNDFDMDISEHLRLYGEWAEGELEMFLQFIQPGDIVVDVGANIGAFTVPLAKKVGPTGRVHAFEPQKIINQRLNANVVVNGLENVDVYLAALGAEPGNVLVPYLNYNVISNFGILSLTTPIENQTMESSYNVTMLTLDSINFYNLFTELDCPSFMKMDVELMEKSVLQGGVQMINRCRPIIHAENNHENTTAGLIEQLYSMDYVPFWDLRPSFNPAFKGIYEDISDGYTCMNILCIPKERLASEGGNVHMGDYVQVERDRPFLREYFWVERADGTSGPMYRQHFD